MYRVFSLKENKFAEVIVKEPLKDETYMYLPKHTAFLLENEMFFDLWLFDYVRALTEYLETKSVESSEELDELRESYPEFYKIYLNALFNERRFENEKS